jgi:hypothetical protein
MDTKSFLIRDEEKRLYRERMEECERAARAGNLPAIVDAIEYCVELDMPPPAWIIDYITTLVARQMLVPIAGQRGNVNSRQARWTENQKHYLRWDMVKELLEPDLYDGDDRDDSGLTLERARAAVSEKLELEGSFAKGGEDAIKRSCELVEARIAQGRGFEFYNTRFKPNGK